MKRLNAFAQLPTPKSTSGGRTHAIYDYETDEHESKEDYECRRFEVCPELAGSFVVSLN